MSCRLAPVAISSMPQQAVANGIGHRLFLRTQLASWSSLVTTTFSGRLYRHWNTPFRQA